MPKTKKPKYDAKTADKMFSLIIRKVGKCFKCESTFNLQCAHIISRRYHSVRWSLDNAVCLCSKCHVFYTYRPLEWDKFIIEKFGGRKWLDLRSRALTYQKTDYKAVIEGLTGQLNLGY